MSAAEKKFIEVFTMDGSEVVRRIEVTGKNESAIAKVEMGLLRNMDLENYSTRVVSE